MRVSGDLARTDNRVKAAFEEGPAAAHAPPGVGGEDEGQEHGEEEA